MADGKDLLGNELTETETELMEIFQRLRDMAGRDDLDPCVVSNVRFAAAAMWQIVNDLNLDWGHHYDVGV